MRGGARLLVMLATILAASPALAYALATPNLVYTLAYILAGYTDYQPIIDGALYQYQPSICGLYAGAANASSVYAVNASMLSEFAATVVPDPVDGLVVVYGVSRSGTIGVLGFTVSTSYGYGFEPLAYTTVNATSDTVDVVFIIAAPSPVNATGLAELLDAMIEDYGLCSILYTSVAGAEPHVNTTFAPIDNITSVATLLLIYNATSDTGDFNVLVTAAWLDTNATLLRYEYHAGSPAALTLSILYNATILNPPPG